MSKSVGKSVTRVDAYEKEHGEIPFDLEKTAIE